VGWDIGLQCVPRRILPGVRDAATFRSIGLDYGFFNPNPRVPIGPHAAVLTDQLTAEIIARTQGK
jgi:hypothetical protein